MRKVGTSAILIILFLNIHSAVTHFCPASACTIRANVPLTTGEWVYFALWKLEANGLTGPIFTSSRPLEREEIAQVLANIREGMEDGRLNPDPLELGLISKLEAEFARDPGREKLEVKGILVGEADYRGEWEKRSLSVWSAGFLRPSSPITIYEEVDVGRDRPLVGQEGRTASRRINTWRWDYTADFSRAYLRGAIELPAGGCEALLGRQYLFWGPAYGGSLILSDESPAFDMLMVKARFGPVKAVAFSAVLDKKWSEKGEPPRRYLASRFLSGHRIDWAATDRIELGLCEVILYGGEARNMELAYVNPVLPYYASQWNMDQDDNLVVSADLSLRPVDGLKLYGQFLIDDFHYTNHAPNALGYTGGIYLSGLMGMSRTDLRAEYTRIDTWTYTHRVTENQYTHYGWSIGHPLGSDADQMFVELSRMINLDVRLKLIYTFGRQGSRTAVDRYVDEDYRNMSFPSGPMERRHKIGLQFLWEPVRGPQVNISAGGVFVRSQDNTTREAQLSVKTGILSGMEWFGWLRGNK